MTKEERERFVGRTLTVEEWEAIECPTTGFHVGDNVGVRIEGVDCFAKIESVGGEFFVGRVIGLAPTKVNPLKDQYLQGKDLAKSEFNGESFLFEWNAAPMLRWTVRQNLSN